MQGPAPRSDPSSRPLQTARLSSSIAEAGAWPSSVIEGPSVRGQWFVTHSAQPHLDGGYTVFGRVNEVGMKVVDKIVRGDKIFSVKIVELAKPPRR